MGRTELRIPLRHLSERGPPCFFRELYGKGARVQVKTDLRCAALATQNESRAQGRMSGEGQFFLHGENANADAAILFVTRLPGKNEGRFGEIHFARQGLHLFGAKAAAVEENGERITSEGAVGKHVDLHQGEFARGSSHG